MHRSIRPETKVSSESFWIHSIESYGRENLHFSPHKNHNFAMVTDSLMKLIGEIRHMPIKLMIILQIHSSYFCGYCVAKWGPKKLGAGEECTKYDEAKCIR